MRLDDLSLVIPVYNEADNVPALFDAIGRHLGHDVEILICYDFEEDNTLPAVERVREAFPGLRLVRNRFGRGALGAIKSGMEEARGPAVLVVMADLSDDLACVAPMMGQFAAGCHVVAGSRYMKGGQQLGGPWLKRTLSRIAGLSLHHLVGLGTHDATNSFRLYSKELLQSTPIESDGGFELGLELTVKAHLRGLRVCEVPTTWTDRTAGQSRFALRKWLPKYLRWYWLAIRKSWMRRPKSGSA